LSTAYGLFLLVFNALNDRGIVSQTAKVVAEVAKVPLKSPHNVLRKRHGPHYIPHVKPADGDQVLEEVQ
jgi:hypothetical protein